MRFPWQRGRRDEHETRAAQERAEAALERAHLQRIAVENTVSTLHAVSGTDYYAERIAELIRRGG